MYWPFLFVSIFYFYFFLSLIPLFFLIQCPSIFFSFYILSNIMSPLKH